jgi:Ca2+/H+ antiporter
VRWQQLFPFVGLAVLGVSLAVSLVSVIGLAKAVSPSIEAGIHAIGAPRASIGIAVALIVLLAESAAAIRAALANRLQTSMNLALGSALATIGLTVRSSSASASPSTSRSCSASRRRTSCCSRWS